MKRELATINVLIDITEQNGIRYKPKSIKTRIHLCLLIRTLERTLRVRTWPSIIYHSQVSALHKLSESLLKPFDWSGLIEHDHAHILNSVKRDERSKLGNCIIIGDVGASDERKLGGWRKRDARFDILIDSIVQMIHKSKRYNVVLPVGTSGGNDKLELIITDHVVEHCVEVFVCLRFKCKRIFRCLLTGIISHVHGIHGYVDYKRTVFVCCIYIHKKGLQDV